MVAMRNNGRKAGLGFIATTDLLHLLLERAAGLGVLGLDDLVSLAKLAGQGDLPENPAHCAQNDVEGAI